MPLTRGAAVLPLQEILGRDHRDLVVLLNNLSVVMHKNGRNMQAELLQRRALEIGREKLGPRHEQVRRREFSGWVYVLPRCNAFAVATNAHACTCVGAVSRLAVTSATGGAPGGRWCV